MGAEVVLDVRALQAMTEYIYWLYENDESRLFRSFAHNYQRLTGAQGQLNRCIAFLQKLELTTS